VKKEEVEVIIADAFSAKPKKNSLSIDQSLF